VDRAVGSVALAGEGRVVAGGAWKGDAEGADSAKRPGGGLARGGRDGQGDRAASGGRCPAATAPAATSAAGLEPARLKREGIETAGDALEVARGRVAGGTGGLKIRLTPLGVAGCCILRRVWRTMAPGVGVHTQAGGAVRE